MHLEPDVEIVVPIESLDIRANIPFTFKAENVFDVALDVYAQLLKSSGSANPTGFNTPMSVHFGQLGVGAERYYLYDVPKRTSLPVTETEENLMFRIRYYGSPGGVPEPREINHEDLHYKLTYIDFDDGSYALVDADTFEVDLEGWTKTDESGTTTLDRSTTQHRNGAYSMRHSGIDNTDVAYLSKSFVIGAVSKAFIRVPVFFEVTDQEKIILELITDAGAVLNKRTVQYAIAGAPAGGSSIAGMWLYLGAELPVNGTYEVRLRATCEGGTALEIFYDDIKDKPTAPSGFSLKGRLYAFIRTNSIGTTAYVELWNATAASQIVQLPTTGLAFEVKRSDLFDIPDPSQAIQIRIWDSDASYQAQFRGGWIELIGVKN